MDGHVKDESFNALTSRFLDWLERSGTNVSSKIELADLRLRNAGRGVVAKEDIEEDEELFAIPKSSILTLETSSVPAALNEAPTDPWLSLILAMMYEFRRGSESNWSPYFDILPEDFDTLMYWSEEELRSLDGSAVLSKIGKASADRTFTEDLIPIVRRHEAAFDAQSLTDDDLLRLCHRMGSTIMAYAFDLENNTTQSGADGDGWEEESDGGVNLPKGVVPLADMLNANADLNNAKLFYEDEKVVMKAVKPIRKGEEIFNDYGPLPRADVLRRYGYITDNYARYDVVEISLDLVKTTAREDLKMQNEEIERRIEYLDEEGALDDGYDISRTSNGDGPFSEELKILLNALVISTADFDKLKKKGKLPKLDLSKEALNLLYGILLRRRAMYPAKEGTLVSTSGAPQNGHPALNKSTQRRAMAAEVIAGEKQVLQEAAEALQGLLGDEKKRKTGSFEEEAEALHLSLKRRKDEDVS